MRSIPRFIWGYCQWVSILFPWFLLHIFPFWYLCITMVSCYSAECLSALGDFLSLESFIYKVKSSTQKAPLTSFFFVCISYISFSSLIVPVKTLSTLLNRLGDNGHPCLFLILVKMLWLFLYILWFWWWSYCILPLLCWDIFTESLDSSELLLWRLLDFVKGLFTSSEMIMWFLSLNLFR